MIREEFNKIKLVLDNLQDQEEMSRLAMQIIVQNNFATSISDDEILRYYALGATEEQWQNLYLLDRSIPYLKGVIRPAWHQRILYFPGTYIIEDRVLNNKSIQFRNCTVKFLYKRNSGSHDHLVMGPGKYCADFYFWINNACVDVEYKFANKFKYQNIEQVKQKYASKKHLYSAKVVTVFLEAEEAFYIIDYEYDTVEKLNIASPTTYLSSSDIETFKDPLCQYE